MGEKNPQHEDIIYLIFVFNMKKIQGIFSYIKLILTLVRRDYAVQYAGTFLGFLWLIIQYSFQLAVYFVLFGIFLSGEGGGRFAYGGDYFLYIMSGMMLWVPISEMLIRSCSIIYDSRTIVKRTGMGMKLFIWIPVFQGILYFLLLFFITFAIGIFRNGTGFVSLLSVFYGIAVILFFGIWANIFSKISLILKDFTPVMRLLLQILFWFTPIVYALPEKYNQFIAWNPFYGIIELNRALFHTEYVQPSIHSFSGVFLFAAISISAALISRIRLESVALDQL